MSARTPAGRGLGRRCRTLAGFFASWADVWLGLRVAGWSLLMPALRRTLPLPLLTRLLWRRAKAAASPELDRKSTTLVRWILPSERGGCVTRSLVLYRMLSAQHRDVELVFAMRRLARGWTGHAWIRLDGRPFAEAPSGLDEFTPVVIFGARGAPREADRSAGGGR